MYFLKAHVYIFGTALPLNERHHFTLCFDARALHYCLLVSFRNFHNIETQFITYF